ncbi:hypothetical protein V1477_002670 [Vespula maculifrons]|uniref:Uncharacterized protein n=1 Tax=Vespula maculifrons TaxID=7453 RepID=A0ABD2CVE2_VESMC
MDIVRHYELRKCNNRDNNKKQENVGPDGIPMEIIKLINKDNIDLVKLFNIDREKFQKFY